MGGAVPVARRNILADRRRLVTSLLGVGAAIALILILQGLWTGFRVQISTYEDHVGADLFVAEAGARNFFGVPSVLPPGALRAVRDTPGVERADPVVARFAVLDLHGHNQFTFVIGSVPGRTGGPWRISTGRAVRADDEVVVDRSLAYQHGIAVGDRLAVMGRALRVVGLSAETRSWMAGFVFLTQDAVGRLLGTPEPTSFVLVRTHAPAAVARAIRAQTGFGVLTPRELADNDRALLGRIMNEPLGLMLLIAFLAGTLIVALTVYSAIVERIREYGIAKAMGARRGRLFRVVLGQTVIIAGLGMLAGVLLARGGSWLVVRLRPQMWIHFSPFAMGEVAVAAGLMALFAAFVPTRRVARLDPASVYRG
jgi:putative ABC transport system permease protein